MKLPARYAPLLTLALVGCGNQMTDGDLGVLPQGCPGNANVSPQSAVALPAGMSQQGYLCPAGNQHWFQITVPAGNPLLSVDLENGTTVSPVQLEYTLRGSDGMKVIDQTPPPKGGAGRQVLKYTHCVAQPGTYYLQVQSYDNSASDSRNPFTISYTTSADPEQPPRGTPATALVLSGSGSPQQGFLSCKGNSDYYSVTAGASTLLDISLTTTAPTPTLNLQYTLVDASMNFVGGDKSSGAMTAPTAIAAVRALPAAGTYYLIVTDQGGSGSDITHPYTLTVKTVTEPDASDKPERNDTPGAPPGGLPPGTPPTAATVLGSWNCAAGMALGKSAFVASVADVDWYKINLTPPAGGCVATAAVSASWSSGGKTVQPQVSLVYPDLASPCMKDTDCKSLTKSCGADTDCEYLGNQCDSGKCTGSAVCLPEGFCGALQYAKQTYTPQPPAMPPSPSVSTSQPLGKPPFSGTALYIRVRDFQSQGYDYGNAYNLGVSLQPDENEPNNFYSPYVNFTNDAVLRNNTTFVSTHMIALDTPVTSKIAFERDKDYYFLPHPCPGQDCTISVTISTTAASPVLYTYSMEAPDGSLWNAWPAAPAMRGNPNPILGATKIGDGVNTCLWVSHKHTGNYTIWVGDLLTLGSTAWDQTTHYTFTVHKEAPQAGWVGNCSPLCATAKYGCGM